MANRTLRFPAVTLAVLLAISPILGLAQEMAGPQRGRNGKPEPKKTAAKNLTEEQRVIHLLDRATFGPRPGDVERVKQLGWRKYLDEQFRPERISDTVAEEKLKGLESINMTNEQIASSYPPPQVLRAALQARGVDITEMQNAAQAAGGPPSPQTMTPDERQKRQEANAIMRELGFRPQGQIIQELQQAKILRAVYSERQLQEVMTDFWFNHFNVFAQKGADRLLVTSYERDVIRPNVFAKFEDLLRATAKSPAMLFYLDNWQSTTPRPQQRRPAGFNNGAPLINRGQIRQRQAQIQGQGQRQGQMPAQQGQTPDQMQRPAQQRPMRGINENYAREIMELHTLGVDGGYTQKDVQEVARCLTGWTIRDPRRGGEFYFNPNMHDSGEKVVLGEKISAGGGMDDGEKVIKMLAHHPSTAKFISTKLARKFVSDNPPASLVARMAETFKKTNGDIREVLLTMFNAPEFWSPESFRAKIKTPFEMTVSAVRAVGAETNGGPQFHRWIAQMGEGLYLAQPPTGYSDTAEIWVNTGALLERMNFSLALVAGRIPGTRVDLAKLAPATELRTPVQIVDHYLGLLLRGQVSPQTRATLDKNLKEWQLARAEMGNTQVDQAKLIGMILGSPEFQRQ
jgi:uncharacterized protein (DUF1800 family)